MSSPRPIPIPGANQQRRTSNGQGSPGYASVPHGQSLVVSFMSMIGARERSKSQRGRLRSDDSSDCSEDEWDEANRIALDSLRVGNYSRALKKFSFCIEQRPEPPTLLKRAAILLRLERYHDALSDATYAVELSGGMAQAVYCQGLALLGLGRYESALDTFKRSSVLVPSDEHIERAIEKTRILLKQTSGEYDWESLYRTALVKPIPACAEHVGPVVVEAAGGERGRGLFVTRDVKAGELLVVSNAAVLSPLSTTKQPETPVISSQTITPVIPSLGALTISAESPSTPSATPHSTKSARVSPQAPQTAPTIGTLLAHTARASPLLSARLWTLFDGSGAAELPIPKMALFESGVDPTDLGFPTCPPDGQRLKRILKYNTHGHPLSENGGIENRRGIWILPSFINHACVGNVSQLIIGSLMVIRAATDLPANTELVVPYVPVDAPLETRLEEWNIICRCQRCQMEFDLEPQLQDVLKPPEYDMPGVIAAIEQLEDVLEAADLDVIQEGWVRQSRITLYMALELELEYDVDPEEAESLLRKIVDAYMSAEPCTSLTVRMASVFGTKASIAFPKHAAEWRKLAESRVRVYFGPISNDLVEILREALVLGALRGSTLLPGVVEVV